MDRVEMSQGRNFTDIFDALRILEVYTKIPSGSLNLAGVDQAQRFLADILRSMGFAIHWHENPLGKTVSAPLLEARLPGRIGKPQWITFVSHADTLDHGYQKESEMVVQRSGERLVAPGVLDDKASQILALWALEEFLSESSSRNYGLRFVSSPNEELGSSGFHQLYKDFAKDSVLALGLEPAFQGRHIVDERRGNRWYNVEVLGIEAHSGRDPEKGLSALHELSLKISKIIKINAPKKGLSLNIGEITSDNATYNLVSGRACAKIDLRFIDSKNRDLSHKYIHKILQTPQLKALKTGEVTKTRYEIVDDCPPLKASRESKKLAMEYVNILRRLEGNPNIGAQRSGGAADVCHMARSGLRILDGLGACGGNMHRKDEFVHIPSIQTRAKALGEFLKYFSG
jgi:glutamate carboxypeptidase